MANEINNTKKQSLRHLFFIYLMMACVPVFLFVVLYSLKMSGLEIVYTKAFSFLPYFVQKKFLTYLLVGFTAQIIDGALGMAYGLSASSFLISAGVPPAAASASIHISEIFTTGISGFSHWWFGNIDKVMFKKLIVPGVIGSGLGAYFLSSFDGNVIKPYISFYLLIMGVIIVIKAMKKIVLFQKHKHLRLIAFFGGFVDASGGGGWGSVVATTLIGKGNHPKLTIGSVNAVEFFITLCSSVVFVWMIGIHSWLIIAGLIIGGTLAAPLGAFVCHRINVRFAMILVGLLIIFLSVRTILLSTGAL